MDIGLDSVEGFMALIIHTLAIICYTVISCYNIYYASNPSTQAVFTRYG